MFNKLTGASQKLSPGLRRILSNTGWLFAERALSMVLTLFVGIYVVRYLGPEKFGKLSYATSFVGLFSAIAKLGLDSIVVRNIVQDNNSTKEILGTAFALKLVGSLVTVALIGSGIWIFNFDPQIRWITLIIAAGLIFQAFDVIDLWFKSKVLSRAIVGVRSASLVLTSAAKLLFIALKLPLIAFAWLVFVDALAKMIGMIWIYLQQRQAVLTWQVNRLQARKLLKDSWPLVLAGVMVTIYMQIDQIMLGNMASIQEVGNYAAAVRLSEVWYFFATAICTSVFPAIIRAKQRSEQEYYSKMQQLYDLMAWMALLVAVPITFLSGTLVGIVLGEEYSSAASILALHIWAGPFVFLGVARGQWLVSENLTHFTFLTTSLGAVTNIVLNLILIPHYKGNGAAFATVVSYAVAGYGTCLLYPRLFRTGWMLTKALVVPLRVQQNLIYLKNLKRNFS